MIRFGFIRRHGWGWTLTVSLALLVVLTLIGVTLLQMPGLEQNLSANLKQLDRTFDHPAK